MDGCSDLNPGTERERRVPELGGVGQQVPKDGRTLPSPSDPPLPCVYEYAQIARMSELPTVDELVSRIGYEAEQLISSRRRPRSVLQPWPTGWSAASMLDGRSGRQA